MTFRTLGVSSLVLILFGCSTHSIMRGSVVMKTGPNEAHVCLGNKEVKVGDRLRVYANECKGPFNVSGKTGSAGYKIPCTRVSAGEGVVSSLINEHYSVVIFEDSVNFAEGTVVEKE